MALESGPIGNDHTTEIDDEDIFDDVEEDDSPAEIDENVQAFIDEVAGEVEKDNLRIDEYLKHEHIRTKPDNLLFVKEFDYSDPDGKNSRYFPAMMVPFQRWNGKIVAYHCTYLSDQSAGKADIAEPEFITEELYENALHGAFILLGEISSSVAVTTDLFTGIGILGSTNQPVLVVPYDYLASLEFPEFIKEAEFWVDNTSDKSVETCVSKHAGVLIGNRQKAFLVTPEEENTTWLSIYQRNPNSYHALRIGKKERIEYSWDVNDESDDEQNYQLPLLRKKEAGLPYPVDALGPILKETVRAIAEVTQAPDALCAQCILAAAALVVQPYVDVKIEGRLRPTSVFLVSIGESGERKSAVDDICLRPVREHEAFLRIGLKEKMFRYQSAMSVYEKKHKAILKKDGDFDAMERALAKLGPPPEKPLRAGILFDEATIEGLVKFIAEEQPSIGQYSDEGGRAIGGHGMTSDSQLRTVSGYSQLWDGKPLASLRSSTGKTTVAGKRFSMHLMVQGAIAEKIFSNSLYKSQGILSRILPCEPDSKIGDRVYSKPSPEAFKKIDKYNEYMKGLLQRELPFKEGGNHELDPRPMPLSEDAKKAYVEFYNEVEKSQKEGEENHSIRGFASKAAEYALRLAAILTFIADPNAMKIPLSCMLNAIALMRFYLSEVRRQIDADCGDDNLTHAQDLLKWMQARGDYHPIVDIYQKGPMRIRNAKKAKEIMGILEDHGWVEFVGEMTIKGQVRKEVWKLI